MTRNKPPSPEPEDTPLVQAGILKAITMIADNVDEALFDFRMSLRDHVRMDTITPEEVVR